LSEFLYPATLLDVVACRGALTCNLGICNSPGLAKEIEKMIASEFIDAGIFKRLDIKLNGCPNACGRHPVGKLALHGMVKKEENRPVPFYKFLVGGIRRGEEAHLAEEAGALPAKNVPAFLREFLKQAEIKLKTGIKLSEFLLGEAKEIAKPLISKYGAVPSYSENRDFYIDWGDEKEFSLAGLGPGECGAGIMDMIEADLRDAKQYLGQGELYKALILSARALLVTRGIETISNSEILAKFKDKFVEAGVVAYRFKDITEFALSLLKQEIGREEAAAYVSELHQEVSAAFQGMDSSLKFPVRKEIKKEAERTKSVEKEVIPKEILLDLRGVACPINYVKARMKLENMEKEEKLLMYLDAGEPIQNVPASLRNDGQDVMKVEEKENYFEVLVKKVV